MPHGIKMKYNGEPVELSAVQVLMSYTNIEAHVSQTIYIILVCANGCHIKLIVVTVFVFYGIQEEAAGFYAQKIGTPHCEKAKFNGIRRCYS